MFERAKYKKAANMALAGNWKPTIIATLIFIIVTVLCEFTSNRINNYFDLYDSFFFHKPIDTKYVVLTIIIFLLSFVFPVFTMAQSHYFLKLSSRNAPKPVSLNTFFDGFNLWLKGIFCSIWMGIWVFFWSLLFIIPGIVKLFSYSQMFFIVAENPKISVMKAMRISKIMTNGHKEELFVMILSFLGWFLLCCLPLVFFYVHPYCFTSFTYSYRHMKAMAISEGRLSPKDFE